MNKTEEKRIFVVYEVSLLLKALQAFLEIFAGFLLYVINTNKITSFILTIAHEELVETPRDPLSLFFIQSTNQLSASGKFYLVFYLLSHGVVKLILIIGLFKKKQWAYPASLIGLGGLIVYQWYRLSVTHSVLLFSLTLMDMFILWLIWREHQIEIKHIKHP
jgi:uncharacterized membrane protein